MLCKMDTKIPPIHNNAIRKESPTRCPNELSGFVNNSFKEILGDTYHFADLYCSRTALKLVYNGIVLRDYVGLIIP